LQSSLSSCSLALAKGDYAGIPAANDNKYTANIC